MPYLCLECGNKSSRKFPGGRCPACDSFKVKSTGKPDKGDEPKRRPVRTKMEVVTMLLLWGFLAWGVWDRYISEMFSSAAGG